MCAHKSTFTRVVSSCAHAAYMWECVAQTQERREALELTQGASDGRRQSLVASLFFVALSVVTEFAHSGEVDVDGSGFAASWYWMRGFGDRMFVVGRSWGRGERKVSMPAVGEVVHRGRDGVEE